MFNNSEGRKPGIGKVSITWLYRTAIILRDEWMSIDQTSEVEKGVS